MTIVSTTASTQTAASAMARRRGPPCGGFLRGGFGPGGGGRGGARRYTSWGWFCFSIFLAPGGFVAFFCFLCTFMVARFWQNYNHSPGKVAETGRILQNWGVTVGAVFPTPDRRPPL